jgi:uncharacterized membrane protein YqjE
VAGVEIGNVEKYNRAIKRREEDSAQPWLKLLVRIFQLVCVGIALGGALSGIIAVVKGRNDWALVAATIALYALVMATLAEWTARFIRKSLP